MSFFLINLLTASFMGYNYFKAFLVSLCLFFVINNTKAQLGFCPSNLDFELGDFTGWECRWGSAATPLNQSLPNTGVMPGRHTIIDATTAGTDPFGNFPEISPLGSAYSVKLGNFNVGAEAESIAYTYTIPSGLTAFSMRIYYAVVIEDPVPSHSFANQPRFQARIIDVATGNPISCVDFDFIPQTTPGGFQISRLSGHIGSRVFYKDWTPVSINLNAYIGQTIRLEFITRDCLQNGHAGYAYVDVGTVCNGAVQGSTVCIGDNTTTLTAPFGFQNYTWYADNTFGTVISNNQSVTFTPPPTVGAIYPVVVEPYPGFGCRDTLYATINVSPKPVSVAGGDVTICEGQQIQIGGPPTVGYSYSWSPAGQVSNAIVANPFAWNTGPSTEFIVTTTDLLTGCTANDSVIITTSFVDTTLLVSGKKAYCAGDPTAGTLSVNSGVTGVQWYNGNTPIPGATGLTYQPTTSGNYWAQLQQSGCTDSSRIETFTINPIPVSVAGADASICTNKETIQLGTTSNPSYTYLWTPTAQVSDPSISNPIVWTIETNTTEFIVHTVDPLTGCSSYDTTYITGRIVDTSLSIVGKNEFCDNDPAWGSLFVSNTLSSIQWFDGTNPIPGATNFNYRPLTTGNFWAQVQQNGCTDSTLTIPFAIHATPAALFTASSDSGCVTNNSFQFFNNSTVSDGAALNYLWKFSDGTIQTITDAVKSFTGTGNYLVKLITTTAFGCSDSTANKILYVLPNANANFIWDSICTDRPVTFYNLTNENGSAQVQYNWTFNNGGPGSTIKDPLPVVYTTAGQNDVILKVTALGCENNPDSIIRKVQVNKEKQGVTYRPITVPQGYKQFIHARDTVGISFKWQPQIQLNNYNTRFTEFSAINDVLYNIEITDKHTCITTDTLQMLVLKKPGYYLPSAFTPNGDGLNDLAIPYLVGMKSLKSFSVFNRWGELIFQTKTEGKGWDGKFKGVQQPTGVYVWILEFISTDNTTVTEKGTITIIR